MGRYAHTVGTQLGEWRLVKPKGKGGNGEVWEVVHSASGNQAALKALSKVTAERYARFRREVETLEDLRGFPGILPVLDSNLPDQPTARARVAWYVMPLAEPIRSALRGSSLSGVASAVAEIGDVLDRLLSLGIHHRDIKPSNLYRYDGHFPVGDFGIVKRLDFEEQPLTQEGTYVGPAYFLPSEAYLFPDDCSPEAIDVYCLAMTLWVLATGMPYPPRSPIISGDFYSLTRILTEPPNGTKALDAILARATAGDPERRPTLKTFVKDLLDWIDGAD